MSGVRRMEFEVGEVKPEVSKLRRLIQDDGVFSDSARTVDSSDTSHTHPSSRLH
jgi:hypothetical protein